jgi:hypothetical protein
MTRRNHDRETSAEAERAGLFPHTRWTVVLAAGGEDDAASEALETLCRTYWFPVCALMRRRGFDADVARDFTQEFFARILSRDGFRLAQQARGRFRSFLSQSVKDFLADEWDKATAQKRGGGRTVLSLDALEAEDRYREATDAASPDVLFDRQWAADLLTEAQRRLAAELAGAGKTAVLEVFERMAGPGGPGMTDEAATTTRTTTASLTHGNSQKPEISPPSPPSATPTTTARPTPRSIMPTPIRSMPRTISRSRNSASSLCQQTRRTRRRKCSCRSNSHGRAAPPAATASNAPPRLPAHGWTKPARSSLTAATPRARVSSGTVLTAAYSSASPPFVRSDRRHAVPPPARVSSTLSCHEKETASPPHDWRRVTAPRPRSHEGGGDSFGSSSVPPRPAAEAGAHR